MKALNPNTGQWEDLYVQALDSFPVGVIVEYPTTDSAKLPTGYMFCDGSAISRTEYSELFSLIGTSFGVGDGSTTFNLPSKKGIVTVGINSSDTDFNTIGKTGGSKELQQHTHEFSGNTAKFEHTNKTGYYNGETERFVVTGNKLDSSSEGTSSSNALMGYSRINNNTKLAIQNAGTGNSGNLQPYEVSNFIIKVKPTRVLASTVVNAYNESTENAYSCDYVNEKLMDETSYTISGVSSRTTIQDYSCIVKGGICYFYVQFKTSASTNYDTQLLSGFPAPIKDNYPVVAQVTGLNTVAAVRLGQNGYAYGTSTFGSGVTILISGAYKVRES